MREEQNLINNRRTALVLAVLSWTIVCLGCRYSISHPPTFADFGRLGPGMLEDERKLQASIEVFKAAQLLAPEIEIIRHKGEPRELIGAAMQTKVGSDYILPLLREAVSRGSNDPVVLAGVAFSLVREQANGIEVATGNPSLAQVLTALEQAEPDNGLAQCARAYLQMRRGDTNAARLSLMAAMQKPALRIHGSELRRCVVQAALTAQYPRYTAFMLALGTIGFSSEIAALGKGLIKDAQVDTATVEACLDLGRRHEAQATLFIDQLIGTSIQKQALERLKPPGYQTELQRIQNVRDRVKRAIIFLDSPEAHTQSEQDALAYFETLFQESESNAADELSRKLNYRQ